MIQCFSFELAHRVKSWKKGGMLGTRGRNPLEKGKKEKKCWLSRVIGWNNEFDRRKRISLCRRPSVVVDVERELQRRQQQTTSRRGCPVESLFVGDERCLFNLDQGQRLSIAKQPLSLSLFWNFKREWGENAPGFDDGHQLDSIFNGSTNSSSSSDRFVSTISPIHILFFLLFSCLLSADDVPAAAGRRSNDPIRTVSVSIRDRTLRKTVPTRRPTAVSEIENGVLFQPVDRFLFGWNDNQKFSFLFFLSWSPSSHLSRRLGRLG